MDPARMVPPEDVGRYALFGEIASGGMASVHYGVLRGDSGFARTVAIKKLHAQYAKDREFSQMFREEARVAARIRHAHVVSTLDVIAHDDELLLVMEYVDGEALGQLLRAAQLGEGMIPRDIVSAIVCGALHGLHAAHDATDETGAPLHIVHRDVSPQNILVGADGLARVLDFGIAKAAGRMYTTRNGELKGKLAYMAPEQLGKGPVDRRTDVHAMGVVLWEALTLQRLFHGDSDGEVLTSVSDHKIDRPSSIALNVPRAVDGIVMRALAREPADRFASAGEMALALEAAQPIASPAKVTRWVEDLAGEVLGSRRRMVSEMESRVHKRRGDLTATPSTRSQEAPAEVQSRTHVMPTPPESRAVRPGALRKRWLLGAAAFAALIATFAIARTRIRVSWTQHANEAAIAAPTPPPTPAASIVPSTLEPSAAPSAATIAVTSVPTPPSAPPAAPRSVAISRPTTRPATPKPAPSSSSHAPKHCEWHVEDGISVPTNCN